MKLETDKTLHNTREAVDENVSPITSNTVEETIFHSTDDETVNKLADQSTDIKVGHDLEDTKIAGKEDKDSGCDDSCYFKTDAMKSRKPDECKNDLCLKPGPDSTVLEDVEPHIKTGVPIDQGWAWVILVASTFEMFIVIGVMRCYGIFFLEFQHKFHSTSSVTSLISTLQNVFYSVSGLFVMTAGLQFMSCRSSIVLGGVLTGVAHIITAFVENITAVVLVNGAFVGISLSFVFSPVLATLNSYFKRHLGLANSISNAGVSLGGIILAPLFTHLFKEYGYTGTFLLAAGIYFNIIVFGLFMRPTELYSKRKENKRKREQLVNKKEINMSKENLSADTIYCKADIKCFNKQNTIENGSHDSDLEMLPFLETAEKNPTGLSERPESTVDSTETIRNMVNTTVKNFAGNDLINSSLHNLYTSANDIQNNHEEETEKERLTVQNSKLQRNLFRKLFDFSIMKDPLFLYYLLCMFFLSSGNAATPFYMAPLADEIGVDAEKTAVVLMVVNVVDLFARILCGFISDRNWMKRSTLMALTSGFLGVASCFVHFVSCFVSLVVFAVVVGLLQGVFWSLFAVVIVDYLTLKKLQSALGFSCLVQGLSVGSAMPVAGYLKDATDTYVTSYVFIGILLLIGAVCTVFLPFVQRCHLRRTGKLAK